MRAAAPPFFLARNVACPSVSTCRLEIADVEKSARIWHEHFRKRNNTDNNSSVPLEVGDSMCGSLQECRTRWDKAHTQLAMWRRAAGMLACQRFGSGPNGGFCQYITSRNKKSNECIARGFAMELRLLFAGSSVVDMGCGLGQYGVFFENVTTVSQNISGSTLTSVPLPPVRWLGIDGSEGIDEATKGRVRFVDLASGIPPPIARLGPWDWVMSVEVAEHVPTQGEPSFMHDLVAHARTGVVLSWARPNQGGRHHVNCQDETYVKCAMSRLGMVSDESLQNRLRQAVIKFPRGSYRAGKECSWLRNTIMAFRPQAGAHRRSYADGPLPLSEYEEQVAKPCKREKHPC